MDDFYEYCNKDWEDHTLIPSYRGAYGVSEELENKIKDTLATHLRSLPAKTPLGTVWTSALHRTDPSNVAAVKTLLHRISTLSTLDAIGTMIGELNRYQIRAPLTFVVTRDAYDSSTCRIHFYEPSLGLPSYAPYQSRSNPTLTAYGTMLKKVGDLLGFSNLDEVIQIEQLVYKYLSADGTLNNPAESHFLYKLDSFTKIYPNIPITSMLEGWGCSKAIIHSTTFVITNPGYMKALDRMCRTFELEALHMWLQVNVILTLLPYLPDPYESLHFEFFEKLLEGKTMPLPPTEFAIGVLQKMMPQFLGKLLYEHTSHVHEIKTDVVKMVHRLKRAAIHRLEAVEWLSPATRALGVKKLHHMHMQIGYPRTWRTPRLSLHPTQFIENIIKLGEADTEESIADLGHTCAKEDGVWEDGIYIVNAFYYQDQNKMVIPLGMLQPPFFDRKKSIAWNYGGIGCAIAHEITHGFDDDGRMYDETGSWKNWWSHQDELHYHKQTDKLVKLFDKREYKGGHVNGTLTLDENLADLGGMAIALQALLEESGSHGDRKAMLQDFFTSYAVSWRLKDRSKKAKQALEIDHHAPPEFRVNLIVAQFAEFYEAFDVTETSRMWIAPEHRIKLW